MVRRGYKRVSRRRPKVCSILFTATRANNSTARLNDFFKPVPKTEEQLEAMKKKNEAKAAEKKRKAKAEADKKKGAKKTKK